MVDTTRAPAGSIDPAEFRRVLGHHPTGVVVVTALTPDGRPLGMTVGSFSSVSLDPPLIAFAPDRRSSSFAGIRETPGFCVNVLGAEQQELCRRFASRDSDRFAATDWSRSAAGTPVLAGCVAWVDCDIEAIHEAGDHYIVVGRVRELAAGPPALPLIFFQGAYGQFSPVSLSAPIRPDLVTLLRLTDRIRPHVEGLARELDAECQISAVVEDELVIVSSAARPDHALTRPVGRRTPFVPPLGLAFVAWSEQARTGWFGRYGAMSANRRSTVEAMLERVRERGWSVTLMSPEQRHVEATIGDVTLATDRSFAGTRLHAAVEQLIDAGSYEPAGVLSRPSLDVRYLSAPIADADGRALLACNLFGLPDGLAPAALESYGASLLRTTAAASTALAEVALDT